MGYMANEEPSIPAEVVASAMDRLDEDETTLVQNEATLDALAELTPVFENEHTYFVLGSYRSEPIRRLNLVVDRLNRRPGSYSFRMVDIRGEWENSIQKFCLVADIVSYLVGVAEVDAGGFLVEQGLLVGTAEYFSKSYVLKREYDDEGNGFDWMQQGVFELFGRVGRLFRWRTEADLVDVTGRLP